MNEIIAEFIGTFLLVLLGNGVVANVVLKDTKGHDGGWIVIALGWGLGVFVGVAVAGPVSGAHINPAVTMGLAVAGLFPAAVSRARVPREVEPTTAAKNAERA